MPLNGLKKNKYRERKEIMKNYRLLYRHGSRYKKNQKKKKKHN